MHLFVPMMQAVHRNPPRPAGLTTASHTLVTAISMQTFITISIKVRWIRNCKHTLDRLAGRRQMLLHMQDGDCDVRPLHAGGRHNRHLESVTS